MICITCGTQFTPPGNCPQCHWNADATLSPQQLCNPGDVLGARYSILEHLGTGRFGTCFKATDFRLNAPVVLKFVHPAFLPTPPHFKRFVDGMTQLTRETHPSLARMFDVGQLNNQVYFTTEFLDGSTLEELIRHRVLLEQPFTIHECFSILQGTAAALIENSLGVHGALHPQNIFIQSGAIRLADFGIVPNLPESVVGYRLSSSAAQQRFVAPEVLEGEGAGTRSDVYSIGAILGEMLTLQPFEGDMDLYREARFGIPPEIVETLRNALAPKRRERYRDCEILLTAIADAADLPTPHFHRSWADAELSSASGDTDIQEDKTAQIVMKDVIQQHYEEITSVRRNPLLESPQPQEPQGQPSLPRPGTGSVAAAVSTDIPKPPRPTAVSLPRPTGTAPSTAAAKAPASTAGLQVPRPSGPPAPPKPGSIAHKSVSAAPPAPPIATADDEGSESMLFFEADHAEPDESFASVLRDGVNEESQLMTLDDSVVEFIDEESQVANLSDLEEPPPAPVDSADVAAPVVPPVLSPAKADSKALDDIDPRFLRAAQTLSKSAPSETRSASSIDEKLADINPRFLRAAKALQESKATVPAETAAMDTPFDTDSSSDDWRTRISQELESNDESMVSFLPAALDSTPPRPAPTAVSEPPPVPAVAPSLPRSPSAPPIPAPPRAVRVPASASIPAPSGRISSNIAPPPPPPPIRKL